MIDDLWYHPESDSYFIHVVDGNESGMDWGMCLPVTGHPEHEKEFLNRKKEKPMYQNDNWQSNPEAAVAAAVSSVADSMASSSTGTISKKKRAPRKKTSSNLPDSVEAQSNFVDQNLEANEKLLNFIPPSATIKGGRISNPFKESLDFVAMAHNSKGLPHEFHVRIHDNFIYSTDGILTVGHPVSIGANFNPKLEDLRKVLAKFPRDFSITIDQDNSTFFVYGDFRAVLPCLVDHAFPPLVPDQFVWGPLNSVILEGFKQLDPMVVPKGEYVAESCIRLKTNVMEAVSKRAVQQYWHGWTLPYEASVPKQAVRAVLKCGKDLASLGYGEDTITFFFTDGAWIKTQVYKEPYPEIDSVFNQATSPETIPVNFFKALDTIKDWLIDNTVFVRNGLVSSWPNDEEGTNMRVQGLHVDIDLILDYISLHMADSDLYNTFFMNPEGCFFFGEKVRLAIRPTPENQIKI